MNTFIYLVFSVGFVKGDYFQGSYDAELAEEINLVRAIRFYDSLRQADIHRNRAVKDAEFGKAQCSTGKDCIVSFDIPGLSKHSDFRFLEAVLTRPTGKEEYVHIEINHENKLVVNFTPTEPGKHLIDVKKKGRPVIGSPFEVIVSKQAEAKPLQLSGKVGENQAVNLDIPGLNLPRDLKYLEAELTRPSGKKESVKIHLLEGKSIVAYFTPTAPGIHSIDIKKHGRPVRGSPFEVVIAEGTRNRR